MVFAKTKDVPDIVVLTVALPVKTAFATEVFRPENTSREVTSPPVTTIDTAFIVMPVLFMAKPPFNVNREATLAVLEITTGTVKTGAVFVCTTFVNAEVTSAAVSVTAPDLVLKLATPPPPPD